MERSYKVIVIYPSMTQKEYNFVGVLHSDTNGKYVFEKEDGTYLYCPINLTIIEQKELKEE